MNEIQVAIASIFNKCVKTFIPAGTNHKICSYCNEQFTEELWCKNCDPYCIIEGWTSGNSKIDKFIKDIMYDARNDDSPKFLEWAPFDNFTDMKQIDENEFP